MGDSKPCNERQTPGNSTDTRKKLLWIGRAGNWLANADLDRPEIRASGKLWRDASLTPRQRKPA